VQVDVLRLQREELGEGLGHRLVAAGRVEAHGVAGGRSGDDDLRVPAVAGAAVQVLGQPLADAAGTVAVADVQVGELRYARPQVRDEYAEAGQPAAIERAEGDRARRQQVLDIPLLVRVRVLAVSFTGPVGGIEVAASLLQLRAALDVEGVNALAAVDVPDAR
jgi:hypothetical protein